MKTLLCGLILIASIGGSDLPISTAQSVAVRYPASAPDLQDFYRAIQALSRNPVLNETALAIV